MSAKHKTVIMKTISDSQKVISKDVLPKGKAQGENETSLFDRFTQQYALSKTLRFELVPVGSDGKRLSPEKAKEEFESILAKDKEIKDAYVALKPVMDKIHEQVINRSLTSGEAKGINFSDYFKEYKKGKEKKLDAFETDLRESIAKIFEKTANDFAREAGNDEKNKPIFKKRKDKDVGVEYLTHAGILKYIENNIAKLVSQKEAKDFIDKKEISDSKGKKQIKKTGYLAILGSFFTYFSGYNQNRENYYSSEEKATAVATRIVHENLPKFCDNCIQFHEGKVQRKKKNAKKTDEAAISRKGEYLNAYQFLKDAIRTTQIKDAATNQYVEADTIDEDLFEISKFSECLSQAGIEEYNRIIGHYNSLINLYNQARKEENDFKKLPPFKTLYKQIGCGEKKAFFFELKYDTRVQQDAAKDGSNEWLNLEETLNAISSAGKKYFEKSGSENEPQTVHKLIAWLKQTDDWDGIYWSKAAVDKVSDKYFANWHDIKDRVQAGLTGTDKDLKEVCQTIASYSKKREEQFKINDAVELSGLFDVLNQEKGNGWSKVIFKEAVVDEREALIDENLPPGQNLINLICADMEDLAKDFCGKSEDILKITNYKNEDNILKIKEWLDTAKSLIWLIKYVDVKASKIKGNNINPELTNMLDSLLKAEDADWFKWYDAVRNYLSKKPQDDAKKNKLKLNFGNPILLGGWSDGQEKSKSSVLIKNGNKYYVGILIERSLFDTAKKNNPVYNASDPGIGRLILENLAYKTLAGKGFVRDYQEKYSDMGKRNPQEAIRKLQSFIKQHYVSHYPLLMQVVDNNYTDKKSFDKEVQDVLTDCYECDFSPVNWDVVMEYVNKKKLFLFEIYSRDFSDTKGEKSKGSNVNLQTKYWEHIFQNNSTIQLCGGGELFFREKAINNDKIEHPANQPIERKSDGKKESIFSHHIIKDKRFKSNKFLFHIPIRINYQAPLQSFVKGKVNPAAFSKVNDKVNDLFTQTDSIQFLGIDRGEKHLIYYSLLDARGNIKDKGQGHFDIINNKNYLQAINDAADIRKRKQENWQQKGNISNLKDGYISLVVHEIIQKMKDRDGNFKPTFVVMEDLNPGFKRSRQKFEQQVYQKFELALAKKLNYLVDKNAQIGAIGSITNALQLTPPVANYQDIENRKQVGIILYTRANYTSVTDPATGWRKTIYLKKGKEEDIKKQILETFSEIDANQQGDYFFEYKDENTGKAWTLWSGKNGKSLERYRTRRGKDKYELIIDLYSPKEMLDKLFRNFDKTKSLKQQLENGKALSKIDDKNTGWESLRFVIDLIQQIRNSGDTKKGQDDNFLLSPVRNEKGEHFDSRTYNKQENPILPKDADANGAYNIARKGIIMHEHIRQWIKEGKQKYKPKGKKGGKEKKETTDLDLFVSDKEWAIFLSDKEQWKEQLKYFASRKEKSLQQD